MNLYLGQSSPETQDLQNYQSKDRERSSYNNNRSGEIDYSITSNRDSPRLSSQSSNSPDPRDPSKQRHEQNQSPGENSRSYTSQRNDRDGNQLENGYHSPTNDSIGSRSPVNLNNNNSAKFNSHLNEMLDHKLQLSFLGPPLAALHSMTEMKGQSSPNAPQGTQVASNPHGIDTILSRPPPVTSAGLNALASGELKLFKFKGTPKIVN